MRAHSRHRRKLFRAALGTLLAVSGTVVSIFGDIQDPKHRIGVIAPDIIGAAMVLLGGWVAVKALASAVREGASTRTGEAKGLTLARIVSVSGYVIVFLWTLNTLGVSIQALLLGGALTGVVLGIAAQQTLGNIFAGLVLLVVRPFVIGQETVIKSTLGEYNGIVENIGMFYVTLKTSKGRVDVPNAVALASAVGPGASTSDEPEELPPESP